MATKHPQIDLKSPVGRLVAGDLATASTRGHQGKVRDKAQYFFALACDKRDPAAHQLIQQIIGHAWQSYGFAPNVLQTIQHAPGGNPLAAQNFAWKIDDGDDPKFADREGYPGHWIFKFATTIPFRCADEQNQQIDPSTVNLGMYGDVAFSCSINGNTDHTAGIYLNPQCFRRLGYGTKIIPGRSINDMMGAAPTQLPPGASLTPVAPASAPGGYAPPPAQGGGYAPPPAQGGGYAPPPAQAEPNPMLPPPASDQAAAGYAPPAQHAPSAGQPGYPATAYPSNVQPHPTFANGGHQ